MSPRVIHTAQALVDVVVEVPALPRRGGNVMAASSARYAGGAVTILLAAVRSGAQAVHAGAHGRGPNGDLVRETLAAEGISLPSPVVEDLDTGVCVVLVEPSAERTFVTTQEAERRITPESLQTSAPVAGDLVCVSGYTLLEPTGDPLLTWLESLPDDVVVVLDPGAVFAELDDSLRARVVALTDVWTGNAEESEDYGGAQGMGPAAEAVAAKLKLGAVSVVRDGEHGCAVHADGVTTVVPGYPEQPVDTNGAGDTHTGVLLAERAKGAAWPDACRRANAAGAIKVTRKGPTSAPTAAEIDDYLAERG